MDMGIKYPTDVTVDERVRRFVERFYELSDDGTRDGEWVGCFAGDALLVMGNRRGKGVDEIRRIREGMWDKVKSRRHRVDKVFPAMFGSSGFEYMLNGTVDLEMKSGEMVVVEWAGQAALGEFGGEFRGELRFLYYRVWL